MKVEAKVGERRYAIQIEPETRLDANPDQSSRGAETYRVAIAREDSSQIYSVEVLSRIGSRWTLRIAGRVCDTLVTRVGDETWVELNGRLHAIQCFDPRRSRLQGLGDAGNSRHGVLKSQMPGKVVKVLKQVGDEVALGEGLVVIEAMKMQNELKAPRAGTVEVCNVTEGQTIEGGVVLFELS